MGDSSSVLQLKGYRGPGRPRKYDSEDERRIARTQQRRVQRAEAKSSVPLSPSFPPFLDLEFLTMSLIIPIFIFIYLLFLFVVIRQRSAAPPISSTSPQHHHIDDTLQLQQPTTATFTSESRSMPPAIIASSHTATRGMNSPPSSPERVRRGPGRPRKYETPEERRMARTFQTRARRERSKL